MRGRGGTGGGRKKGGVGVLKRWEKRELGGKLRNKAQYFAIEKVLKEGSQEKRGGA